VVLVVTRDETGQDMLAVLPANRGADRIDPLQSAQHN
jgi:hypothetical protein